MKLRAPTYQDFLEAKIKLAPYCGFEPSSYPDRYLKPHAAAIAQWAIRGGRRAIFASFGLHKTSIQLDILRRIKEHTRRPTLCVIPLGVRQEFFEEAERMGVGVHFIRSADEILPAADVHLTNYETVRDGKLDPKLFAGASLDEASVLRSFGSKTYQQFLPLFEDVPYRFVATATPSPNRYKELLHYAGFLGVMDTGQALTRFFQRNAEKANDLTLYPHKEEEFWLWVHSWAVFVQKPSDLGFSDEGYILPELEVRYHELPSDHSKAAVENNGQMRLLRDSAQGIVEAAREKRESMDARIGKMREIIDQDPAAHFLLWHSLEDERRLIEKTVPESVSVYGTLDLETREQRVMDFAHGREKYLATKPEISGSGCNFQRHCHRAVFTGIDYDFNDFIQSVHRIRRFGQTQPCVIDIIYTEAERDVKRVLLEKWARHDEMTARMSDIIKRYGLSNVENARAELSRTIGVELQVASGERYHVENADCVDAAARKPDNSVGMVLTSIPFSNHYEYTDKYNDFGHTDDNDHFWAQMDFLTPELFRVLKPGRIACIHVKDRILFGNQHGTGLPTVSPFHAEAIFHYKKHGFDYMGMIHINTDVVRENNQTYRLGYSEMCKDGTRMGVGCPEYVLIFHKPQSDRSRGFADEPVVKDKAEYSLARWQVDAHAFWRSSGNRLLTIDELINIKPDALPKIFTEQSLRKVYDYREHYGLGEEIEERREGALPRTFMALAPGSHDPNIWHDVNRMRTLNGNQVMGGREKHVCPLQFDIVDRCIERWSNKDDIIFDPFGGIMTVPYRAMLLGRRGMASELHPDYFRDGVSYLQAAERKQSMPDLFSTHTEVAA